MYTCFPYFDAYFQDCVVVFTETLISVQFMTPLKTFLIQYIKKRQCCEQDRGTTFNGLRVRSAAEVNKHLEACSCSATTRRHKSAIAHLLSSEISIWKDKNRWLITVVQSWTNISNSFFQAGGTSKVWLMTNVPIPGEEVHFVWLRILWSLIHLNYCTKHYYMWQ